MRLCDPNAKRPMAGKTIKSYWADIPVGSTRDLGTITPSADAAVPASEPAAPQ